MRRCTLRTESAASALTGGLRKDIDSAGEGTGGTIFQKSFVGSVPRIVSAVIAIRRLRRIREYTGGTIGPQ
jgi:hypothetical protein